MSYDDYEQSERVRAWLRQNGVAIVAGIVIGLALIFGYRQWNKHKADENIAAANQYAMIQNAITQGKTKEADTLTDSMVKNHADSAYAVFAVTLRANRDLADGKPEEAVKSLDWAVKHADKGPLKALTNLRLARAQLDAGKAKQSLLTLKAMPADGFQGLAAELRGDAQVKLGHAEAASKAYQTALAAFDPTSPQRRILKMKMDNLATQHAATAVSHAATVASPASSEKQDA